MTSLERATYEDGRISRSRGFKKNACPYGLNDLRMMHFWLAGWNDRDLELEK